MAVKGNLNEMTLSSLISINCNEMSEGCLQVEHGRQHAAIYFADGSIVHMTLDDEEGEQVLPAILAWQEGDFEFQRGVHAPKRSVSTPWAMLLVDSTRVLDDAAQHPSSAPDEAQPHANGHEQIAARLRGLPGVQEVVLVASDGILMASSSENADRQGAAVAFVTGAARQIGDSLYLGPLEKAIVETGRERLLLLEAEGYYVGLLLDERTSPSMVADAALSML